MLDIDGAWGEGGGQLVRTAVALAAITHTPIRVRNVRAARRPAGLAPQHLAAVRAAASLCRATATGVELRATSFDFVPGDIVAGEFHFDVGTAGSITLLAQALLPVMLRAPARCRITLLGGTDVRAAPPFDYFRHVLLAHLAALGVAIDCELRRRGYFPRGGGMADLTTTPARPRAHRFEALHAVRTIEGCAHSDHLDAHVATRMADAARARLHLPARIAIEVDAAAACAGGAITLWSRDGGATLGAGQVAQRGVRAETLGDAVGVELAADLAGGAGLDIHAADQLLVWLALAAGESSFTTREVTQHARTAMWLIRQFLPVDFDVEPAGGLSRVRVRPHAMSGAGRGTNR
ncbi:MAG: RNA 3'-terminal phosphate cyclase [Gemmatimonadota bacterium]